MKRHTVVSVLLLLSSFVSCGLSQVTPQAVLSVRPNPAFTGQTVTLKCDMRVGEQSDWHYQFYGNGALFSDAAPDQNYFKVQLQPIQSGEYHCVGILKSDTKVERQSAKVTVTVSAKPTSTLVSDRNSVLTSDSVTLTCTVEDSTASWNIYWYRDKQESEPVKTTSRSTYTFTPSRDSRYWCRGQRGYPPYYTHYSNPVDITDSANRPPTLVSDRTSVLTSNTVTLTCTVDSTAPWNIYWYRDKKVSRPVKVTRETTYKFRASRFPENGTYWCRGGRGDPANYTQYSNPVDITVSAAPVPVLSKHWPETYVGETLILKCTIPGSAAVWTYKWLKNGVQFSSENNEFNFRPSENNSVYLCIGQHKHDQQLSEPSESIIVSLKDQPKATLTAEQTVIPAGSSVALNCSVEGSGWNYYWYQHFDSTGPIKVSDAVPHSVSPGPITVSEGGVYRCRGGRGNLVYYSQFSDVLTLNTMGDGSGSEEQNSLNVGGLVGGVLLVILLTILVVALLCKYTGPCGAGLTQPQGTNQSPATAQMANQSASPDNVYCPLQHGDNNVYEVIHQPDDDYDNDPPHAGVIDSSVNSPDDDYDDVSSEIYQPTEDDENDTAV